MTKEITQLRDTNGKKWAREDNKNKLHCYFKNNPTQKGGRKWTIGIWAESARFNTSQKLVRLARIILKKGWFYDLEILEICGNVNNEVYEDPPTRI